MNIMDLRHQYEAAGIARTARHYKAIGCGGAAGNLDDGIAIRTCSDV